MPATMTSDPSHRLPCVVEGDGSRAVLLVVVDDVEVMVWRFGPGSRPDLGVVDALARLQLAARRRGGSIRLRDPCPELRGLLELVGLAEALLVEAGREPELGEQPGVEEVVQAGDPAP
jgi:hypothetical protein